MEMIRVNSSDLLKINDFDISSKIAPQPNLRGIVGNDYRDKQRYQTYIHRTGYIGMACNLQKLPTRKGKQGKIFDALFGEHYFQAFLKLVNLVTVKTQISSPYQIKYALVNARGAIYFAIRGGSEITSESPWKRDRLPLPVKRLDSVTNVEQLAGMLFERVQNAFGIE